MIRRPQEPLTVKKFMDEVVFSALDWPGKTVRLERNTTQDYCQRPSSSQLSVAELYHENSKLFPAMVAELTAGHLDCNGVRLEFLRRRSETMSESPQAELSPHLRELLREIAQAVQPELFYAIELRIAENVTLASHEPLADRLPLIKRLSGGDTTRLTDAIRLLDEFDGPTGDLLLVIGNFARNDLLFGVRGYRRTLIEAGRITEAALGVAARLGMAPRLRLEFADRAIDGILEADGIEEGILAIIQLGSPEHDR